MESREALAEKVTQIIQETIGSENPIELDHPLLQSGLVDSFSILQIYLALQSQTGAELGIEDITEESFASIGSIVDLIESRVG